MKRAYAAFPHALADIRIVEFGSRLSVGVCGSILAQAGAEIVVVAPLQRPDQGKWLHRAHFAAGKSVWAVDLSQADDLRRLHELIGTADAVVISGDFDPDWRTIVEQSIPSESILCDLTAFGTDAPIERRPATDAEIQAVSGVAYTTGFSDGPPVLLKVPVLEYSAGLYGAAAILIGVAARAAGHPGQSADISLYDCAVNSLVTFLPAHFGGGTPQRLGNGHSMASPWNTYSARDGWLMICSATDAQWIRLCRAMQRDDLETDPRFAKLADRVRNREAVDEIVNDWMSRMNVQDCVEILSRFDVPNGIILQREGISAEPNFRHRAMVVDASDDETGFPLKIPGNVFKTGGGCGPTSVVIPAPDRKLPQNRASGSFPSSGVSEVRKQPLAGLRVVEIGQYTTAPLVTRHMATFGAEVIKVEPPSGDAARAWPPQRDGLSYFFLMSNNGKESVVLDLKDPVGRDHFIELIRSADVFVENLKPGSMARIGLGPDALAEINRRLVYCQITGFGMDSVYGEKPAYDTVIQAMSGMMGANAFDGTPLKAGISAGDFIGGQVGLIGVLAALHQRELTGLGQYIDLSMQDAAAWMSSVLWEGDDDDEEKCSLIECSDGFVCWRHVRGIPLPERSHLDRRAFIASLEDSSQALSVRTVAEMAAEPLTSQRNLLLEVPNELGPGWPALNSPMRLSRTPPVIDQAIGLPRPFEAGKVWSQRDLVPAR